MTMLTGSGVLVGKIGGGALVGIKGAALVGTEMIAVGNSNVGRFVGWVTEMVVGAPLFEIGVHEGCSVVSAVAV